MTRAQKKVNAQAAKVRKVIARVQPQFPETPEAKLMYAIFEQALKDLVYRHLVIRGSVSAMDCKRRENARRLHNQNTAQQYVKSDMPHAEICDVDSDWIRRVMREERLDIR